MPDSQALGRREFLMGSAAGAAGLITGSAMVIAGATPTSPISMPS